MFCVALAGVLPKTTSYHQVWTSGMSVVCWQLNGIATGLGPSHIVAGALDEGVILTILLTSFVSKWSDILRVPVYGVGLSLYIVSWYAHWFPAAQFPSPAAIVLYIFKHSWGLSTVAWQGVSIVSFSSKYPLASSLSDKSIGPVLGSSRLFGVEFKFSSKLLTCA